MTSDAIGLLLPEIVLIAAAIAIYLGGAFFTARRAWNWLAGGAVILAGILLWAEHGPATVAKPLAFDELAWFIRWLALAFGAIFVLLTARPLDGGGESENIGSVLLTIAGLMLVAEAADMVLLFVGLELISIPTYVLLYLGRCDRPRQEAAAKYFFLSVLASSILLYGFSFLYGVGGSTDLASVRAALDGMKAAENGFFPLVQLGMVLVFAGLCFKIAAVPFHFYAPDVYQGTTHPNAALLSLVPKAAGMVAIVRILTLSMPGMAPRAWQVVLVISAFTMTYGNVLALWQNDLRRLLAYSGVAHGGYMLMALAVGLATPSGQKDWNGIAAVWFYLATYALATAGAFAVLESLGRANRRIDMVDELAGLARTQPKAAAVLAVFMFSLTGIPPLAGFWGKFLVFGSALNAGGGAAGLRPWFITMAVIGALNAAVAAAYYLRIVMAMYFRSPQDTIRPEGGRGAWWAAVACAAMVIALGCYPGPLMRASNEAVGEPTQQTVRSMSPANTARE